MDAEQIRAVTEFAELAPSVHNTQPWRFVATGHSIEVHADPDRQLAFLDPSGRQLHISCGLATEYARLAIRAGGRSVIVRHLPDPQRPTLLARLTVGGPEPVTPAERRLVEAAVRRYTDRGPYDDRPVPAEVLARLRDAAAEVGGWLRVLDRPGDRVVATTLLSEAEAVECAQPAYRDELDRWRRPAHSPDGLPVAATAAWPGTAGVDDVPLRDFTGVRRPAAPGGDAPTVRRDPLVLVGVDGDDPRAWVRAGRALARVLLTLGEHGLVSQPLGPVTDVPATRQRLRRELGLIGHPQLLLRIGYGHRVPETGRRPVDEVLTVATG